VSWKIVPAVTEVCTSQAAHSSSTPRTGGNGIATSGPPTTPISKDSLRGMFDVPSACEVRAIRPNRSFCKKGQQ
jgi:hypothetical protein